MKKTQKLIYPPVEMQPDGSAQPFNHGLTRGQRTVIDGERVVITRTKQDTVWYREETLAERVRLWLSAAWKWLQGV